MQDYQKEYQRWKKSKSILQELWSSVPREFEERWERAPTE